MDILDVRQEMQNRSGFYPTHSVSPVEKLTLEQLAILEDLIAQYESFSSFPSSSVSLLGPATYRRWFEKASAELAPSDSLDDYLAQALLGIAGSLYTSLKFRHVGTAHHSLRVALICCAWGVEMEFPARRRYQLEIAALLHDVGMIGVPDEILYKPGKLSQEEKRGVLDSRQMTLDILRRTIKEQKLLEMIEHVGAWYDGSQGRYRYSGEEIPIESRMISIVEAFDAMTGSSLYRPAMSQQRAFAELFACEGTQFDPKLVEKFTGFYADTPAMYYQKAAHCWLHGLDRNFANAYWNINLLPEGSSHGEHTGIFERHLLDHMNDAVIFVDRYRRVIHWNRAAEKMTGISSSDIRHQRHICRFVKILDEKGDAIDFRRCHHCPIHCAMESKIPLFRRLNIQSSFHRRVTTDTQCIPVLEKDGSVTGAILVLRDASSTISWEKRFEELNETARLDPLTGVPNRRHFERVFPAFVEKHHNAKISGCIVICDLDHFKKVNDTYGHQVGDEILKALAGILQESCREAELVARYGGEEFVLLSGSRNAATTMTRMEEICRKVAGYRHPSLKGKAFTASFGVTEIEEGDTAESFFRRADRALFVAKSKGRNRVEQMIGGQEVEDVFQEKQLSDLLPETSRETDREVGKVVYRQVLASNLQRSRLFEKLEAFAADQDCLLTSRNRGYRLERKNAVSLHWREKYRNPVDILVKFRDPGESEKTMEGKTMTRIDLAVIFSAASCENISHEIAAAAQALMENLQSYLQGFQLSGIQRLWLFRPLSWSRRFRNRLRRFLLRG